MSDEQALERLLQMFSIHYEGGGFHWQYMDGVTIGEIDPELEAYLMERFESVLND